jgi:exportin-7
MWDGQLCRCVFQLVTVTDLRANQSGGTSLTDGKLEIAILNFFKSFKRVYMSDNVSLSAPIVSASASPAHPLLSLALSYPGSSVMDAAKDSESLTIFDAMKVGDLNMIMNLIVTKICNNIKFWHRDNEILEETLEVFVELVSTYSSSKTLLGLESIDYMVHSHVGTTFPFLGYDNDNKHRITFYSALGRLVFSAAEDLDNSFDTFIEPNIGVLAQLAATEELRSPAIKMALVGILRDLRGICLATNNKRTFNLFFDAVFPIAFPLLFRVAETWNDDHVVMTALLKFMQEFVQNKGQRVMFEQCSANGILLFRQTSQIVCSYGSRILALPVMSDIYIEKYKGIRLMLNVLTMALSGNYVNFGVFSLYEDPALQNVLDVSLRLCLQIPLADVLAYVKLSKAFYGFLEVLFRSHLDALSGLDSAIFLQLMKMNHEGLQSSDLAVSALCASTIDHIATYMFLNQRKDKPTVQHIRQHISSEPDILNQIMNTLFSLMLFNTSANHWAVTRPILSLMLASEASFVQYQEYLISTQPGENIDKLREEFGRLLVDIQQSVETTNRDRFTQKLTLFRLNVRQFLAL